MITRFLQWTIAIALLANIGCEQSQQTPSPSVGVVRVAKESPAERAGKKLDELIKSHSAITFPDAGVGNNGQVTTLDYQEAMEKLRGKM